MRHFAGGRLPAHSGQIEHRFSGQPATVGELGRGGASALQSAGYNAAAPAGGCSWRCPQQPVNAVKCYMQSFTKSNHRSGIHIAFLPSLCSERFNSSEGAYLLSLNAVFTLICCFTEAIMQSFPVRPTFLGASGSQCHRLFTDDMKRVIFKGEPLLCSMEWYIKADSQSRKSPLEASWALIQTWFIGRYTTGLCYRMVAHLLQQNAMFLLHWKEGRLQLKAMLVGAVQKVLQPQTFRPDLIRFCLHQGSCTE